MSTVPSPPQLLRACRSAEARLAHSVAGLTEERARAASRLPDWSRAHVLAHLIGNADSVSRRVIGVLADRIVDQYPGGQQGRTEEIERLATEPVAELVATLEAAVAAMFGVLDRVPDDCWSRLSRSVDGNQVPADRVLLSRWTEVEIHHVDLDVGYEPADWPADFVAARLPGLLDGLPGRADPRTLLAWASGRAAAPELSAWS